MSTFVHDGGVDCKFVEILSAAQQETIQLLHPGDDDHCPNVDIYFLQVPPQQCSTAIKKISKEIPLQYNHNDIDLTHLKRVRKPKYDNNNMSSASAANNNDDFDSTTTTTNNKNKNNGTSNKKPKLELQVLVGLVSALDEPKYSTIKSQLEHEYGPLYIRQVPKRPAESQQQWKEWNNNNEMWPTSFFPLKSPEYHRQQLALKPEELEQMKINIRHVLSNCHDHDNQSNYAIIANPLTGTILTNSQQEYDLQIQQMIMNYHCISITTTTNQDHNNNNNNDIAHDNNIDNNNNNSNSSLPHNPLATPILFAIQGISRKEREAAMTKEIKEFAKGQYLCTGYDLYTKIEPTIFEAMACVHARLRRLIFVTARPPGDGGCTQYSIHCLPGTNHHYRVFQYRNDNDE